VVKFPISHSKHYQLIGLVPLKHIYDYDDFGPELNKTGYFEEDLKGLLMDSNKKKDSCSV
jgi:hypothetical protein